MRGAQGISTVDRQCYTEDMAETLKLPVTGMTCGGCENAVKLTLSQLKGIEAVAASHRSNTVDVRYDGSEVTLERIKEAIEELGYHVGGETAHCQLPTAN